MATLLDLAKRLDRRVAQTARLASDVSKLFTEVLVGQLTTVTPVDTSKALSNWQVSIGAPSAAEIEAHSKGKKGSTALASADKARGAARLVLKDKRPGQTIYVINPASYIADLNSGSSKQAPAGFVEMTLDACRSKIPQMTRTVLNGRRKD